MLPKRHIFSVCIAIASMSIDSAAEAAIAGYPPASDVQAVEDCLQRAKSSGAPPESCISALAAPCEKEATAPPGKSKCIEREEAVWDANGVRDVARLRTRLGQEAVAALGEAQSGYERAKLGLCSFVRISRRNTPEALFSASTCRMDAAARYDLWLRAQFDALSKQ